MIMALFQHLRRLFGGILMAIALLLGICFLLMMFVLAHFRGTWEEGEGSGFTCGLVFGAAVHRDSVPGPGIERRVATAARLYGEELLQHIILTGGKGDVFMKSEADVMREVALRDGISRKDITLETASMSTWENLKNSKPLTGSCATIVAISDNYHLARIGFMAERQGWGSRLKTYPADTGAPWYFQVKSILREVGALLYYIPATTIFQNVSFGITP
jgi:uncharacterized SAM-binding protein YcdF (DUF218 family)